MSIYFDWTPPGPSGQYLVSRFTDGTLPSGQTYTYLIEAVEGLGSNFAQAQLKKAPYQTGSSIVGVNVEPRTIAISLVITAITPSELENVRRALSARLGMNTTQMGKTPELGTLTYKNHADELFSIKAMPINSPQFIETGSPVAVRADLEFLCPDPHWSAQNKITFTMNSGGNYQLTYPGDAPTPVKITGTGGTNPYFSNSLTGESIGFKGTVGSFSINTEFGKKEVLEGGSSAMHKIDLARNRFWYIVPGTQYISTSGTTATFEYTPKYFGV